MEGASSPGTCRARLLQRAEPLSGAGSAELLDTGSVSLYLVDWGLVSLFPWPTREAAGPLVYQPKQCVWTTGWGQAPREYMLPALLTVAACGHESRGSAAKGEGRAGATGQ